MYSKLKRSAFSLIVLLMVLPISLMTLSSCGEDEGPSNLDLLVENNWVITVFRISITSPFPDSFSLLEDAEACELDDVVDLMADKTFQVTTGPLVCQGQTEGAILGTGGWDLSSDQNQFSLILPEGEFVDIDVEGIDPEEFLSLFEDMDITTLTSSTFQASKEQNFTVDINNLPLQVTLQIDLAMDAVSE